MIKSQDIKKERWEDSDFVITGLHHHGGVFTNHEADIILKFIQDALPIIQLDAWKQGMSDAAIIAASTPCASINDTPQNSITRRIQVAKEVKTI